MHFDYCPRCGLETLESLARHQHCVNCNYSPTLDPELPFHLRGIWEIR